MPEKPINEVLADNLKRLMDEHEPPLKQASLAAKAQVSQRTMSNYLNPKNRGGESASGKAPSAKLAEVELIAEALKVAPWQLLHPEPTATQDEETADLMAAWAKLRGDGRLALLSFSKHLLHEPQTDARASISIEAAELIRPYDRLSDEDKKLARRMVRQVVADPNAVRLARQAAKPEAEESPTPATSKPAPHS